MMMRHSISQHLPPSILKRPEFIFTSFVRRRAHLRQKTSSELQLQFPGISELENWINLAPGTGLPKATVPERTFATPKGEVTTHTPIHPILAKKADRLVKVKGVCAYRVGVSLSSSVPPKRSSIGLESIVQFFSRA